MNTSLVLLGVSALLRAGHHLYYRDSRDVLIRLKLAPGPRPMKCTDFRALDPVLCAFPFIWAWLEIIAAHFLALEASHAVAFALLALLVGGRLRALHEFSHLAIHGALAKPKRLQWLLADVFFHYPVCKFDSKQRHHLHCKRHHPHANDPLGDPNISRFRDAGFVPGMGLTKFYYKLLYPLTWTGLKSTARTIIRDVQLNDSTRGLVSRLAIQTSLLTALVAQFGVRGLVFGYLVPVLVVYPWYSWLALIVEHRWYVGSEVEGRNREFEHGRPTDYPGVGGWFVKAFISPAADHFHLAHSLYPHVRWNHLPAIDKALKARDPRYCENASVGLFHNGCSRPSALSELRERMTNSRCPTLADWAKALGPVEREQALGPSSKRNVAQA